jgi:hypothetical protein
MKKNKPNLYNDIIEVLVELKTLYPSYSMGKHISTALDDYGDIWGLSDKEILYAFTKYKANMEMDVPHETNEEEIEEILKDGMNLSASWEDEEEDI